MKAIKETLDKTKTPLPLSEMSETQLKELQVALSSVGFFTYADGELGPKTLHSWSKFLASVYSAPSDSIGWGSWSQLNDLVEEKRNITSVSESSDLLDIPYIGLVALHTEIVEGCGITWGEMTRQGSRMPVSQQVADNMVNFAESFKPIRQYIGEPIVVTSAYRPPSVNRRVRGSSKSWHLYDRPGQGALDFYVPSKTAKQLYQYLHSQWDGGLAWSPQGFVHIDNGPKRTWKYS